MNALNDSQNVVILWLNMLILKACIKCMEFFPVSLIDGRFQNYAIDMFPLLFRVSQLTLQVRWIKEKSQNYFLSVWPIWSIWSYSDDRSDSHKAPLLDHSLAKACGWWPIKNWVMQIDITSDMLRWIQVRGFAIAPYPSVPRRQFGIAPNESVICECRTITSCDLFFFCFKWIRWCDWLRKL